MNAESKPQSWAIAIAEAEKKFTQIAGADGNLVSYQREAMFALQSIGKSDYLQKCTHESIRNSVINVASVGLTLNPAMKLAYIVPRSGVACLDISYIGLVKIATDSGGVLAVAAVPVRLHDVFAYKGPFETPRHDFNPFDSEAQRGDIVGVYTLARLASGVTQVDTISREEIDKIRSVSKAKNGPWFEWFDEMVKKSAIKRASKMWPRTERLAQAEALLNEHQGSELTIDGDATQAQITGPERAETAPTPSAIPPTAKPLIEVMTPEETIGGKAGTTAVAEPPKQEVAKKYPPKQEQPAGGDGPDVLTDGHVKVLRARMTAAGVTEDKLDEVFKAKWKAPLAAGSKVSINRALPWARELASKKAK